MILLSVTKYLNLGSFIDYSCFLIFLVLINHWSKFLKLSNKISNTVMIDVVFRMSIVENRRCTPITFIFSAVNKNRLNTFRSAVNCDFNSSNKLDTLYIFTTREPSHLLFFLFIAKLQTRMLFKLLLWRNNLPTLLVLYPVPETELNSVSELPLSNVVKYSERRKQPLDDLASMQLLCSK